MDSVVLVLLTALLMSIPASYASDCNITRFDETSARVVFYGEGLEEPATRPALTTRCENFDRDVLYLKDYTNKCFSGLANGMVKLVVEGAAAAISHRCIEGADRDKYLRLVPCLNSHRNEFQKCNKNLAAILEGTLSKPKKDRIPLSCCYMGVFVDCITKTAKKCGAEHHEFAKSVVDYYSGDLLSTVCVRWKYNSKACKNLPRISPASSPKYKAILAPLAEVLTSLQ